MTIDKLLNEEIYSMGLKPDRKLTNNQQVWTDETNKLTFVMKPLNDYYKVLGYHIKEPYQLTIPYKEFVKEYLDELF